MRKFLALFTMMMALLTAACKPQSPHFKNIDITNNSQFASDFSLLDSQGKRRSMADFKDKVVLLFFGYLHCPDVCPTTLAQMRTVMEALGNKADRFQVLFVSLDPERDNAALLGKYVTSFHPSFIGLRPANADELSKVTRDFKVAYVKVPEANQRPEEYTIDHFAGSYLFDTQGKLRLLVSYGQDNESIVKDIRTLLN